jgi:pimeloyl-ACP methyl ester carboxylesterase
MARPTALVAYNGIQIETVVEGTGPAIVILPSLGRDGYDDYDDCAATLVAAGWRVLRPQPRGIGRSSGPMEGVLLPDLARDIAEVVRQQGDGRAVLVGHAFGNWVARMTAVGHPEVVRGVVLAAASARDPSPEVRAALTTASDLARSEGDRLAALAFAFFAPGHDPSVWLHGWYPTVQGMQAASSRGAITRDVWWQAGTAPLLELIPDRDPFKPPPDWHQLRDELGERITVQIIPDASHALFVEQSDSVARAIDAWARHLPP